MQFKSFDDLSIQDNFIFEKVMREKSICKMEWKKYWREGMLEGKEHALL